MSDHRPAPDSRHDMQVTDFLETLVERERLDDVNRIALARWRGPGHVLGVVFEVGGRWIHAEDYGDLEEADWLDVDVDDSVFIWERKER